MGGVPPAFEEEPRDNSGNSSNQGLYGFPVLGPECLRISNKQVSDLDYLKLRNHLIQPTLFRLTAFQPQCSGVDAPLPRTGGATDTDGDIDTDDASDTSGPAALLATGATSFDFSAGV